MHWNILPARNEELPLGRGVPCAAQLRVSSRKTLNTTLLREHRFGRLKRIAEQTDYMLTKPFLTLSMLYKTRKVWPAHDDSLNQSPDYK